MKTILRVFTLILLLPFSAPAQTDDSWPPLNYLRSDYNSVRVVAHVRVREAEMVGQIPGYDNWRMRAEVLESFKGKFQKGEVIEYFHGAEAPSRKEGFTGERIVFLLAEYDKETKHLKYSVLENSTLRPTPNRLRKLRIIRAAANRRRR
jgi:hypothetical protein